jgi:hypothetical protein
VKGSSWASGQDTFPSSRILEKTDANLLEKFKPNGQLDIEALLKLPTLFIEETFANGDPLARIGMIQNMYPLGGDYSLEYSYDSKVLPIKNSHLKSFCGELGMTDFSFQRTHWAVKTQDLFRALFRNLNPSRRKPIVFNLSEPELIDRKFMSVMMPFQPSFTAVYRMLQGIAKDLDMTCRRADDIWENPSIIQDVVSLIDRSRIVVCDCTTRNPNVFYEIGIAHTLGREVILITQSAEDIPFDLRHLRYVQYLNNKEGLKALKAALRSRLETLV